MTDADRQRMVFRYVNEFFEARTEARGREVLAAVPADLWPSVQVLALAYLKSKYGLLLDEGQRRPSGNATTYEAQTPVREYVPQEVP
jgi:hypothetical protein